MEGDRKRDEMFQAYQREHAEANRKHDLLMAQLLLQSRAATRNSQQENYGTYSHNVPLSNAGNTWNTLNALPGQDQQDESYTYHQL